jgi:large subunit ribosomal protein L18
MNHQRYVEQKRTRRKQRVRNRIRSGADRPRLSVFRSHKHIYAQVIDDACGKTLASASTLDSKLSDSLGEGDKKSAAEKIGRAIAERASAAGIRDVAFDRGPYKYHGRVAALAEGARQGGLKF